MTPPATSLREVREAKGMSRNALEKKVPLQHPTLVKVESCELLLTPNAARKTADVLGVEVEDVHELRAAIEKGGKVGDPCGCSLDCPGTKVLAENPKAWALDTSYPCEWCGKPRIFEPGSSKSRPHVPYCSPCETRIRATERLKAMVGNPFAQAFYKAFKDARITLQECCRDIEFPIPTFWRWMEGEGERTPQLHKLSKFVKRLNAPYLIAAALETTGLQLGKFKITCPRCPEGSNKREDYTTEFIELTSLDPVELTAVGLCHVHTAQQLGERRVEVIKTKGVWVGEGGRIWFKDPGQEIKQQYNAKWHRQGAAVEEWTNYIRSFVTEEHKAASVARMKAAAARRKEAEVDNPSDAGSPSEPVMKARLRKLKPESFDAEFLAQWVPLDSTGFSNYGTYARAVQRAILYYQGETKAALARASSSSQRTVGRDIRRVDGMINRLPTTGEWGPHMVELCSVLTWVQGRDEGTLAEWRRRAELRKPHNDRRRFAKAGIELRNGSATLTDQLRRALAGGPKPLAELVETIGESGKKVSTYLTRVRSPQLFNKRPDSLWELVA